MKKNLTTVDFHGTKEQEEALKRICEEYDCNPDNLMPILQQAQELYGYLPIEVQRIIAAKCHVSLEEVYGIVTFYSQFALNPKGEVAIAVCLGTACYVKGSGKIIERIQEKTHILNKPHNIILMRRLGQLRMLFLPQQVLDILLRSTDV